MPEKTPRSSQRAGLGIVVGGWLGEGEAERPGHAHTRREYAVLSLREGMEEVASLADFAATSVVNEQCLAFASRLLHPDSS